MHQTTRIAVTGIAGGGKTVFMTSLIWQLAEFADADFRVGRRAVFSGFRELNARREYGAVFPFERFRDLMAKKQAWPAKTTDCSHFAFEMRRSDRMLFKQRMHLFDFPGERIADAAIVAFRDYEAWSRHMLNYWADHSDYQAAIAPYVALFDEPDVTVEQLIEGYKLALGRLILGYHPLISPSTFLLDPQGQQADAATPEMLASTRLAGLPNAEFCPLPEGLGSRLSSIGRQMARNYRTYRQRVALPVFKELAACDRLIILVDIPYLLNGGVGRYNDNRQILLDFFETLRFGSDIGSRIMRIIKIWRKPLSRVAYVASKADMVHPDDIRNGRLEGLLRQMTSRTVDQMSRVAMDWFVCSACHSSRAGAQPQHLIAALDYNNPEHKEMEFAVPALPANWPPSWRAGDFRFYHFYPKTVANIQTPPKQKGLDKIFDFITK